MKESHHLSTMFALVTDVDPVAGIASIKDSFGKGRTVRTDIRRGAGRSPAVGEQWFLDRTLGEWTFAALFSNENEGGGGGGGGGSTPVGVVNPYAGAAAPSGWLLCNGASVEVDTYPDLHAVIGYTFGGSGVNFNVPDMRTRFPVGAQAGGDYDRGDTGGAASVALITANLPAHAHTIAHDHTIAHTHTIAHDHTMAHTHTIAHTHSIDPPITTSASDTHSHSVDPPNTTTVADAHTHTLTARGPSTAVAHGHPVSGSDVAPQSGSTPGASATVSTSSDSHTHTVDIAAFTSATDAHTHTTDIAAFTSGASSAASSGASSAADTGASSAANSGASSAANSGASSAANSGSVGSGTAHENRPPFLALNYIIYAGV